MPTWNKENNSKSSQNEDFRRRGTDRWPCRRTHRWRR